MNSVTRTETERRLRSIQAEAHPFCFVCSASNPMGMALRYESGPNGSIGARFLGNSTLEGYPGILHGGVVASLLDGAMTHCLFAHDHRALTVDLRVRYHAGVASSEEIQLRAWLEDTTHGLFQLRSELVQNGSIKASATGKFMKHHE